MPAATNAYFQPQIMMMAALKKLQMKAPILMPM